MLLNFYTSTFLNEGMLIFILDFGEIFFELYYVNISLMKKVAVTRPGAEPVTLGSAAWHTTNWAIRAGLERMLVFMLYFGEISCPRDGICLPNPRAMPSGWEKMPSLGNTFLPFIEKNFSCGIFKKREELLVFAPFVLFLPPKSLCSFAPLEKTDSHSTTFLEEAIAKRS